MYPPIKIIVSRGFRDTQAHIDCQWCQKSNAIDTEKKVVAHPDFSVSTMAEIKMNKITNNPIKIGVVNKKVIF